MKGDKIPGTGIAQRSGVTGEQVFRYLSKEIRRGDDAESSVTKCRELQFIHFPLTDTNIETDSMETKQHS